MKSTKLNWKVFFTIFPKGYWITLAFASLFLVIGGKYVELFNFLTNLILLLFGIKLAVLLHEIGHLVFAKLVGGTPRRIVIGKGHHVDKMTVGRVKIILNSNLNSGLAFSAFDSSKYIRRKLLFYTSGGFITNFLLAFTLIVFFDFSLSMSKEVNATFAIGLANLYVGLSALIPFRTKYQGLNINSDGLSLLKIPFYKKSDLVGLGSINELLDAYDFMESKEYENAINIYKEFQAKTDNSKSVNLQLSMAYLKQGKFQRSKELLEELVAVIEEKPYESYKNFIYNSLAWNYLLLGELENADKYSEMAYNIDSGSEQIRGTRASVLIEKGNFEEGKNLLIREVDFKFANSHTLSAAMYAGLAYWEIGEKKQSKKHIDFVSKNLTKLDSDELFLFERIKERIDP